MLPSLTPAFWKAFPIHEFHCGGLHRCSFVYFLPDIKEMFEEIQEGSSFQHSDESGDQKVKVWHCYLPTDE